MDKIRSEGLSLSKALTKWSLGSAEKMLFKALQCDPGSIWSTATSLQPEFHVEWSWKFHLLCKDLRNLCTTHSRKIQLLMQKDRPDSSLFGWCK